MTATDDARRRACDGKVRFDHVVSARAAATRAAVRMTASGSSGPPVQAYRCPFCSAWHIGHVLSVDGLRRMAAAIRDVDPDPQPHDPPPSGRRRRRRNLPRLPDGGDP